MRNIKPTKVILSAYTTNQSAAVNSRREDELVGDLATIDAVDIFRDATGSYEGHVECSQICWLKPGSILEGIEELTDLAAHYNQSSILVIHGDDAAELVGTYSNRSGSIIGTFQRVDAPNPGEDYTKIDETFYVVR